MQEEVLVYDITTKDTLTTVMCGLREGGLVPVVVHQPIVVPKTLEALQPARGLLQGQLRWNGRAFEAESLCFL